jgi:thioredoxin 1
MEEIHDVYKVVKDDNAVVIEFFGNFCPSCKKIEPVLRELNHEMDKVKFFKFNVEENPDIASEFGIHSIPNMVIFKGQEPVDQLVGYADKEKIKEWVTANL